MEGKEGKTCSCHHLLSLNSRQGREGKGGELHRCPDKGFEKEEGRRSYPRYRGSRHFPSLVALAEKDMETGREKRKEANRRSAAAYRGALSRRGGRARVAL